MKLKKVLKQIRRPVPRLPNPNQTIQGIRATTIKKGVALRRKLPNIVF
jgi:hypothetical protein